MTRLSSAELHPCQLHFHKLQGAGNDFVVLDLFSHPLPTNFDFSRAALALCDRHLGVGSDGLLTLEPATDGSAARMRMWNPDGSEDMCGNGLRCVALLAWHQKIASVPIFQIQTLVGPRRIEILQNGTIRTEMGAPVFESPEIPVSVQCSGASEIEIELPGRTFKAFCLSTGSTHTVIFLDAPLSEADFQLFGPLLENHPIFPSRTNAMFAVSAGANRFEIRIWERGAGETLACGTGACAVAVAAQMSGRARGTVQVVSKGGTLQVDWTPGESIFLTGSARAVFRGSGEFEI